VSLAARLKVDMPITNNVSAVLQGEQSLADALQGLMGRHAKPEH
jgi:glycerol-3-phosphate dehydrogenase